MTPPPAALPGWDRLRHGGLLLDETRLRQVAADGPAPRALGQRLKALAQALGPARAWDVFLGGLGAELAAALPDDPRIAGLLRAAQARRREAYAALAATLAGAEFRTLVWDAVALQATRQGWRDEASLTGTPHEAAGAPALEEFAAAALSRRWRRLRARGDEAAAAPSGAGEEALHELRLDGKRMRYAAELFAPLWPGKTARRFLRKLAALQEALGLANDAAEARRLAASLLGPAATRGRAAAQDRAWAVGAAEGFAVARAGPVRGAALERWESLLRRAPFWDGG